MKFGNQVKFNQEYINAKNETICISEFTEDEIFKKLEELGIEDDSNYRVKKIHIFKGYKEGIYLGTTSINLSIYYEWHDSLDVGIGVFPSGFNAYKSEYIEVAEVRCEGIKKTYYVPIENLESVVE